MDGLLYSAAHVADAARRLGRGTEQSGGEDAREGELSDTDRTGQQDCLGKTDSERTAQRLLEFLIAAQGIKG